MKDVSPKTQEHLTRVYTALAAATASCAAGMFVNSHFMIQGFLVMVLNIFLLIYATFQVKNPSNTENTQIFWMLAAAFGIGFVAGPGIAMFAALKPELLTQAVMYATTAFSGFSAVSLFS